MNAFKKTALHTAIAGYIGISSAAIQASPNDLVEIPQEKAEKTAIIMEQARQKEQLIIEEADAHLPTLEKALNRFEHASTPAEKDQAASDVMELMVEATLAQIQPLKDYKGLLTALEESIEDMLGNAKPIEIGDIRELKVRFDRDLQTLATLADMMKGFNDPRLNSRVSSMKEALLDLKQEIIAMEAAHRGYSFYDLAALKEDVLSARAKVNSYIDRLTLSITTVTADVTIGDLERVKRGIVQLGSFLGGFASNMLEQTEAVRAWTRSGGSQGMEKSGTRTDTSDFRGEAFANE